MIRSGARLAASARELSRQGRYQEAQRGYEQAYQRRPDAKLLYNLARVLHKATLLAEAATYYQRYLAVGAEGSSAQRQAAKTYLEQVQSELWSRPGSLPTGSYSTAPPTPAPTGWVARLSPRRKLLAGVLGGLMGAALVTSFALTASDKQYTSLPCMAMNPADACRLDNFGLYVTGYALTGALAVGVGLVLFMPPSAAKPGETP